MTDNMPNESFWDLDLRSALSQCKWVCQILIGMVREFLPIVGCLQERNDWLFRNSEFKVFIFYGFKFETIFFTAFNVNIVSWEKYVFTFSMTCTIIC